MYNKIYTNYIDSIASPVWIKRVAASGGLLFRGRHSLVSPSLLYILGVRWNKARGQSSTRQGAFDKKGARSLLQIRFHFFVTVLHDASCFCRFSASFLYLGSKVRSLAQAVNVCFPWTIMMCLAKQCCAHGITVLILFCHAGPFIKFGNSYRVFLHTHHWKLGCFLFQVLSRWYEVRTQDASESLRSIPSEPFHQGLRCSTLPSRAGSFVGWPREETNSRKARMTWNRDPYVKDQQSRN